MAEAWPLYRVIGDGANHPDRVEAKVARDIYTHMVLLRTFDEKAIALQRQGRVGTFPPSIGQEAAEIGSAAALCQEDWVAPSYRDHGAVPNGAERHSNQRLPSSFKPCKMRWQQESLPATCCLTGGLPLRAW